MASDGMIILSFFLGILIVLLLVTVHELGHFIVAKMSKAYVYEFAIGFGPRLFTWKGKETWVSIRVFPLGGFCSIASEKVDPPKGREDEEVEPERMMEYVARWKKLFFIIAGPIVNLVVAIFLFTTIFGATQIKANDMNWFGAQYSNVADQLLADEENNVDFERIALMGWEISLSGDETKPEDVIFNNVDDGTEVVQAGTTTLYGNIKEDATFAKTYSETVYFFIDHLKDLNKDVTAPTDDTEIHIRLAYGLTESKYSDQLIKDTTLDKKVFWTNYSDSSGTLSKDFVTDAYHYGANIGIAAPTRHFSSGGQAYAYGWKETFTTSLSILKSLGMLVTGHISQFSGPIGMSRQVAAMLTSPSTFFLYVAMLSANLFILNILTIPPLDGYKFIENIIEMIIKKEIPEKVKIWMYSIGAALFAILFLAIIIHDFMV